MGYTFAIAHKHAETVSRSRGATYRPGCPTEIESKLIMVLRTGLVAIMLVAGATATAGESPSAPAVVKIASSTVEPSTPGVTSTVLAHSTAPAAHLWPTSAYPQTPGDRHGHPIKSCGARNDGERVSTFTVDLDTKLCIVRNFRCTPADNARGVDTVAHVGGGLADSQTEVGRCPRSSISRRV